MLRTAGDLYQEVVTLSGSGRHDAALALVDAHVGRFDDARPLIAYLRACMLTRLGRTGEALDALEGAQRTGDWCAVETLVSSPSLAPLRGHPRFEAVLRSSQAAEREARQSGTQQAKPLDGSAPPWPLLVVLHGNFRGPAQTLPHWRPATAEGWLATTPMSSALVWRDAAVWDDQERAYKDLLGHFRQLRGEGIVDSRRVVVGGFSMGAETAVRAAIEQWVPASAFVLLGPAGPSFDEPSRWRLAQVPATLRGYVIVGDADPAVSGSGLKRTIELLRDRGIPVEMERLPRVGHEHPPTFGPSLERGLAFVSPNP